MMQTVRCRVRAWHRSRRARQIYASLAAAGYSADELRALAQLRASVAVELAGEVVPADPTQPRIDEVLAVRPVA